MGNMKITGSKIKSVLIMIAFWGFFIFLLTQDAGYLFGNAKIFNEALSNGTLQKNDFVEVNIKEVYGSYSYTDHMLGGIIPMGKDNHYIVKLEDDSIISLTVKDNNDIEKLDNSMEGECNLQFVGRLETPSAKIRQYYLECIAEVGEEQLEASAIYSDISIDATENKFTVSILIIGCLLLALISTAGFVFGLMKKS